MNGQIIGYAYAHRHMARAISRITPQLIDEILEKSCL